MSLEIASEELAFVQLRQSDCAWQALIESAGDALFLIDTYGHIRASSQAATRLYGYTQREFAGMTLLQLHTPIAWDRFNHGYEGALPDEETTYRTRHLCKDETRLPVDVRVTPITIDDASYFLYVVRDRTPLRAVEHELAAERVFLNALMSHSTDRIYFKDQHSRFIRASQSLADFFGVEKPDDLIGETDFDIFTSQHAQQAFDDEQRIINTGEAVIGVDEKETWANGKETWASTTKLPLRDARGRIIGTFGISRDITAQKIAEEQLKLTAEQLARSNEELQQFAYVASHDLQEPLRMVASYVQLLSRRYKGKLDADADEFINYAVEGASRMRQLINDLLSYSRIGTQGKPLIPTDCNAVVDRVLQNLQFAIEDHQATVTVDPLPMVLGDAVQLEQLFQNLIGNAMKFHSSELPTVHITAVKCDNMWEFCVQDNGIGIDPQYADRIFVIFQRLQTREQYPGTGFGLSVCKKIVERHGGHIGVESEHGKGSTFRFTLSGC